MLDHLVTPESSFLHEKSEDLVKESCQIVMLGKIPCVCAC